MIFWLPSRAWPGGVPVLAGPPVPSSFDPVIDFLESFEALDDHRQRGKVLYPLDEILLLVLLAVLAGCDCWVEIEKFGEKKIDLLRRFRPFKDGTPSHDQLGDVFAALNAEQFQGCFIAWVGKLTGLGADIIAIDGKTLRRSYQDGGGKAPIHMISAWSCGQNLVLGQAKVAAKSNEITAIPQLLDLLTIKGATISIPVDVGLIFGAAGTVVLSATTPTPATRGSSSRLWQSR